MVLAKLDLSLTTAIFKYKTNIIIPMLTVRLQVKEVLKDSGIGADKISNDFMDKLDEKVRQLLVEAARRAKENGRTTVMPRDI